MRDIDGYTESYLRLAFEDKQVIYRRRKVLERIAEYCPKKVLEIGCGMEPLFSFLPDNIAVTVVEPSKVFCNNAQALAKIQHKKVRVICGFAEENSEDLSVDDNYDMIICSALLHEVENPQILLQAIGKLAVKGHTIVHVNVPNANSLHRLLAVAMGLIDNTAVLSKNNAAMQQHNVFDIGGLEHMVFETLKGAVLLCKGSYFVKPFTHKQMQEMFDRKIINDNTLDGLYGVEKYMPGLGSEIFIEFML